MPLVLMFADSIYEERGWEPDINMQKTRDNDSDAFDRSCRASDKRKVVTSLLVISGVISARARPGDGP